MMGDMCGRRGRGRGGELLISMITSSSSSPPSSSSSSTATTTPVHLKRQRHNPARRRPRTERTNAHDTPFESPRCPLSSKPTWRSPSEVNDRRHSIQSKDLPVPRLPARTCRHTTRHCLATMPVLWGFWRQIVVVRDVRILPVRTPRSPRSQRARRDETEKAT